MALSKIDAANFLTGTIPSGNVANASLDSVTALPAGVGGKVLQVVQGQLLTVVSTTSNSFQTSGLSLNITPSSASNKILIYSGFVYGITSSGDSFFATIFRNGTDICPATSAPNGFIRAYTNSSTNGLNQTMQFLDAPSSSSQLTYDVRFCCDNNGATAYIGRIGVNQTYIEPSFITAMEIEG